MFIIRWILSGLFLKATEKNLDIAHVYLSTKHNIDRCDHYTKRAKFYLRISQKLRGNLW